MKKSDIYKFAQSAVLEYCGLSKCTKLEILRELMEKEDSALYWEEQEKKENKNESI